MEPSTASSSSASPPAGTRWRLAGAGAGSLILARIITAVCGLVQVPIVLAHLGAAGLGLWIALTGLLWSAVVLDGGIGFAVQNRLTSHLAAKQDEEAAVLIVHAFRILCVIGCGTLVIGVPLAFVGNWNIWLGVTDSQLRPHLPAALTIVATAAALFVPLSLSTRIVAARQEMWITGMWTSVASILGLAATIVAGQAGASLAGFVLAACILPLAPHAATWLHVLPSLKSPRRTKANPVTPLWRDSMLFLVPQLGAAFISSLVPTLVTIFAGPLAAATFGVLQRLYGFALQIQTMGLTPTWPAYTHAAAIGDWTFARKTFVATWLLSVVAFIVPTLALTPWVPQIVRLWLGANAPDIPRTLLWITASWYVVQYCGQPIAMLLNGLGRLQSLAVVGWTGIAISLALCSWCGPRWGASGVVFALIATYVGLNLPITGWKARQALAAMRGKTSP